MPDKSWLDSVVEAHEYAESPLRYFWWSGVSCISAIVRKRVYLDKFAYRLYPNTYVMLISTKSGLRKGFPISFVGSLLRSINNTRVISGQNSIQAVLKEFSTQVTLDGGPVLNEAQGLMLSPEFKNLIMDDPQAISLLVDLYNTHEHEEKFDKNLRSEKINLRAPCINLLGASNEVYLKDKLAQIDVEGGFVARTMMVYESKRNCINPLMERPTNWIDPKSLHEYPRDHLKGLTGEFSLTAGVKREFEKWYIDISEKSEKIEDRTGFLERIGDHVLKIGMIISMAKSPSLTMNMADLEEAIEKCTECFLGTKKISQEVEGKSEDSPVVKLLLIEFMKAKDQTLERSKMLARHWRDLNHYSLDRALEVLKEAKALEEPRRTGGKIYYTMNEDFYKKLTSRKIEEDD